MARSAAKRQARLSCRPPFFPKTATSAVAMVHGVRSSPTLLPARGVDGFDGRKAGVDAGLLDGGANGIAHDALGLRWAPEGDPQAHDVTD